MISKKTKEWKKRKFEELKSLKESHNFFVFFNFMGIDVPKFIEIRKKMKEIGNEVKVAKNAFVNILLGVKFEDPTAVVAVKEDPIKTVKVLSKVIEDEEKIKGALLDGKFFGGEETRKLKDSPDMEELRGMVLGSMLGVLQRAVMSLQWYPSSLISILRQKSESQEQG